MAELSVLWMLLVLLLAVWFLAVVSSYTVGGVIHVVLLLAVVTFILQLVKGRRSSV